MQDNLNEKIKLIHNILITVSTGTNITPILNQNYSQLRNELLSSKYKDLLPLYVKSSLDLKQFWSVIKNKSPTYQGRRDILNNDFLYFENAIASEVSVKYNIRIYTKENISFYKYNMTDEELKPFVNSYHYAENLLINGTTILANKIHSITIMKGIHDFEIYREKAQFELDRERKNDMNSGFVFVGGYSNAEEYAFEKYLINVTDKFIIYPLGTLKAKQDNQLITNKRDNSLKKIFISHATKDKEIVEELIDLLETIGISSTQIFCSSFEGYGIPLGGNFLDTIKEELSAEVLVLFVITNNFYDSKVCLCEMGAAWALSKEHIPIVVPPLSYSDIQALIPLTQGLVINNAPKLNSLKEKLEKDFSLGQSIALNNWERKRDRFITNIQKII